MGVLVAVLLVLYVVVKVYQYDDPDPCPAMGQYWDAQTQTCRTPFDEDRMGP